MVDSVQEFIESIKEPSADTTTTYSAVVSRVDSEGVAWVNISGSEIETPTARTSAEVQVGDSVNVEWRNNKLYIGGNVTNPAAGVSRVINVEQAAKVANEAAHNAVVDAGIARQAAVTAQASATDAKESADDAGVEASRARAYADNAFDQLSVVENVIGVLDLLQKNGDYQFTPDEVIDSGKWYFERSGTSPNYIYSVVNNPTSVYHLTADTAVESGKTYYTRSGTGTSEDPYVYTEVATPVVSDIATYYEKYYELVGIDEAIQNYVSSQLVVDNNGLWLKRPEETGIQTKVLLSSTDGVVLYGANGQIVGKYGETAQIGDSAGFHIEISGTELGFYQAENKVAYINNNQLYITQSVVLQQMDLGIPVNDGGLGQWSWKVHANGQTPSRNNLNLKWIG